MNSDIDDSRIREWFRVRWTDAERSRAALLLDVVARALDRLGVGWILYAGTLIGHTINGRALPWDDDVDLLTLGRIPGQRLQDAVRSSGVALAELPRSLGWKCYFAGDPAPPGAVAGYPSVDVAFCERRRAGWVHESPHGGYDPIPDELLHPIRTEVFEGVRVRIPADPRSLCQRKYGEECLASSTPPQWDHRWERPTHYPTVRVDRRRIDAAVREGFDVSVVMPVPPAAAEVERSIASLFRQTDPRWELILIGSGSSRTPWPGVVEAGRNDPRVRVLPVPEPWDLFASRQQALRLAQGDWVAHLGCGDEFFPDHVASLKGQAILSPDVVVFRYHRVDGRGVVEEFRPLPPAGGELREDFCAPLGVAHKRSLFTDTADEGVIPRRGDPSLWDHLQAVGARVLFADRASGRHHVRHDGE